MSPFSLARLELRRHRGHPVRIAAVAAIVLLPAVCAGLYLWSFWDPYGSIEHLPVAVVNEDAGAALERGGEVVEIDGGERLVEQLRSDPVFDWHVTDADRARSGLEDGEYYMVVTIPEDFSTDLAAAAPASIAFERDDANGYLAGVMTATAERELEHQITAAVYAAFAETLFGGLAEGLGGAAETAASLQTRLAGLAETAEAAAADTEAVASGLEEAVGESAPAVEDLAEDWTQIQTGSAAGSELVADAAELDGAYSALCGGDEADGFACETLWEHVHRAESISTDVQSADAAVQATPADALEGASEDLMALQTDAADAADAAGQVADGVAGAEATAADLAGDLGELYGGADAVVSSLTGAHAQASSSDGADESGGPVVFDEKTHHAAGSLGRGLAPLIIPAALWAFGIAAYLLLRPVNPRAVAGPLRSPAIALGGWLAGAALGVVSALALYLVVDVGLGLEPRHAPATIALCLLAVLTFTAMAHAFRLVAGAVGVVLLVVLLVLQVAASGGLYPVETTPAFFQALHPWLPMTYAVDALRVAISGGQTREAVLALAVLAAYLVASLVVASAAVAMRRKWTIGRLHPPLRP